MKQNRGKIGCLIQAVLKGVSAPARFWERGARCFVGRLCLRRPDEAAMFFRGWMTWASTCWRDRQIVYAVCIAIDHCFSPVKLIQKGHAVEGGSRLSDVRGERLSGNVMERSSTVRNSAERLVASAIINQEDPRILDTVYMTSPTFFIYYSVVC